MHTGSVISTFDNSSKNTQCKHICSLEWLHGKWLRLFQFLLLLFPFSAGSFQRQPKCRISRRAGQWGNLAHSAIISRLFKYQLLEVKPICQTLSWSLWDQYSHSSLPNYFHKTMLPSLHPDTSHFFPALARQSFCFWSRNAWETLQ